MEINRALFAFVSLQHDERKETPDEATNYARAAAESRGKAQRNGGRAAARAGVHAGRGQRAARAHGLQSAPAHGHGASADAHGGGGVSAGADAELRVAA